jgi:hypothetical protein
MNTEMHFKIKPLTTNDFIPASYPLTEHLSYNQAMQELLDGEASYISRDGHIGDAGDCILIDEFGEPVVDGIFDANDYAADDWYIG